MGSAAGRGQQDFIMFSTMIIITMLMMITVVIIVMILLVIKITVYMPTVVSFCVCDCYYDHACDNDCGLEFDC